MFKTFFASEQHGANTGQRTAGSDRKSWIMLFMAMALCFGGASVKAQLLVDNALSPEELAQSLVGSGVTVSNVIMDCPGIAIGRFVGVSTNLGLDSGVIMTTGSIFEAVGPNDDSGAGLGNGAPGDPLLDAISSVTTFDACVLTFDVVPLADTLSFRYVFGSEEYMEFVFSGYNDLFAFGISGPGIVGIENIALIPGTSTPVTIDNVNSFSFSEYYIDNGDGFTTPFSTDPFYIQYDGFTTVLEAKRAVIPCNTYTLRLAIADAGDDVWDSGVFLEAGSLTSSGVVLSSSTSVGFGFENAIEGCVDGLITFTRLVVDSTALDINYEVGGTATNGVDYPFLPGLISIPPDSASASLVISPFLDAIPEGIETVTIYLVSACADVRLDSVTLNIQDEIMLDLSTSSDSTICPGQSVLLTVSGGLDYLWSPAESLDDATSASPLASPLLTTTYTVTTTLGTCSESASVVVDVSPPFDSDAGDDVSICAGDEVTLNGSGGVSYSWLPEDGLDDPSSASPLASPLLTTTYQMTASDGAGCISIDEVTVTVFPLPDAQASPDTTVCPGSVIRLESSGGVLYAWSPEGGLDDPASPFPLLTVEGPLSLSVLVTDANGCFAEATIEVLTEDFPEVDAGLDTLVFLGETVQLNGSGTGFLMWSPSTGLSDPALANPMAGPEQSTWYVLSSSSPIGCVSLDSMLLSVIYNPIVEFPNAFSPNGDGLNDEFMVIVRGPVNVEAFRIFNRWGELVFESLNADAGWDGTYKGQAQDVGAYVYYFLGRDPDGVLIERRGTLHLLR